MVDRLAYREDQKLNIRKERAAFREEVLEPGELAQPEARAARPTSHADEIRRHPDPSIVPRTDVEKETPLVR